MTTLLATLCLACQAPPDWSGTYDCCTYTVVIVATPHGYETQWYDADKGKLYYYGVVRCNAKGEWIETYSPELSPHKCGPWRWHVERGMLIGATDHPTWRFKKR